MSTSDRKREKVFVSGASGFIGRLVSRHLSENGWHVFGMRRHGSLPEMVDPVPIDDLYDLEPAWPAMRQSAAVVHAAGEVYDASEDDDANIDRYYRTNTEGTRRIAEKARRADVSRFIFLSSTAVYGRNRPTDVIDESSLKNPEGPYGRSKLLAERALQEISKDGLDVVVLRLPAVYGPGMHGNILTLYDLVHRGVPLPLCSIENARSLLYVHTLMAAIERVLGDFPSGFTVFCLGDSVSLSTPQLVWRVAESIGRSPNLLPCPVPVLKLGGRIGDVFRRFGFSTRASSTSVKRLVDSFVLDSSFFRARFAFEDPLSIEDAFAETGKWYLSGEGLPRRPSRPARRP